jgi:ribonuclease P protein component
MLKKSQRLTRELFTYLQASRRYFHTEHFMLRVADAPNGPRIGISVSKKVAKKAVLRNKIRRRGYSAIESIAPVLPKKLYLIVAKAGADKLSSTALGLELADLLKKG